MLDSIKASRIGELSSFLFHGKTGRIAMLHALCDESYASTEVVTPIYVLAAVVGRADRWAAFESYWRSTMRELGIEGIGCHASKCSNGAKPYEGMSTEKRREIQYRLIVDVVASRLGAVVSVVDVQSYWKHRDKFDRFLGKRDRKYNQPHIVAARQCMHHVIAATDMAGDEQVAFLFDINTTFIGRIREWYRLDQGDASILYRHRLGPLAEDSRMNSIGLQAADLLAYAAFRHFSKKPAWQWDQLVAGLHPPPSCLVTDAEYWEEVSRGIDEDQARKVGGG